MAAVDVTAVASGMIAFGLVLGITIHTLGRDAAAGIIGAAGVYGGSAQLTTVTLLSNGSAILLAAFQQYGLQPGPMLFVSKPDFAWTVIGSMYVGNVMLLILNLPLVGVWARISQVRDINRDFEGTPHRRFVRNTGKPGFIGRFGSLLGEAGVNIATFNLGREKAGGDAICVVSVDEPVPDKVLAEVAALQHVVRVRPDRRDGAGEKPLLVEGGYDDRHAHFRARPFATLLSVQS